MIAGVNRRLALQPGSVYSAQSHVLNMPFPVAIREPVAIRITSVNIEVHVTVLNRSVSARIDTGQNQTVLNAPVM